MQILLKELLLGVSSPKQWLPLEVLLEVGVCELWEVGTDPQGQTLPD